MWDGILFYSCAKAVLILAPNVMIQMFRECPSSHTVSRSKKPRRMPPLRLEVVSFFKNNQKFNNNKIDLYF